MRFRARVLLELLKLPPIILPCAALTEVLTPVSPQNQAGCASLLRRRFTFAPFHEAAAVLSAELFHRRKEIPLRDARRADVRLDTMIVASAKVAGAIGFFSNDETCRAFAAMAGLIACDLPTGHPDPVVDRALRHQFGYVLDGGGG